MAILIGAARQDENNYIGGGKKGDQTGHEVESYLWTDRPGDGWTILRYKDPKKRANAVKMLRQIIDNPYFGYSQWTHGALERAGRAVNWDFSKIDTPVDTDCCDLQRTLAIANGIKVGACYTATQVRVFMATGEFDLLTGEKYAHTDRYLLAGDIGAMPPGVQGHTWSALEDGCMSDHVTDSLYVVESNALRQRSGPGVDFPTIQYLPNGAVINVISYAEAKDGKLWAQGEYNGIFGYCSTKYLTPQRALPTLRTFKSTYLRRGVGTKADIILAIPPMQTFVGTGITDQASDGREWYEVIYNGTRGWVSSKYVEELL